jgi:hypothetical protein
VKAGVAILRRDRHMLGQQGGQPAAFGQCHDRDQPGTRHEVRIVEPHTDRAAGMD